MVQIYLPELMVMVFIFQQITVQTGLKLIMGSQINIYSHLLLFLMWRILQGQAVPFYLQVQTAAVFIFQQITVQTGFRLITD